MSVLALDLFPEDPTPVDDIPVTLDRLVTLFLNRWTLTLRGGDDRQAIETELRQLIADAKALAA